MKDKFDTINKIKNYNFDYLTYEKGIEVANEKKHRYIYFLYKDYKIVYVGKTECAEDNKTNRPNAHTDKDYTHFEMIELEDDSLDIKITESYFIMKHTPEYNKSLPCTKEEKAILQYIFNTEWDPYKNQKYTI